MRNSLLASVCCTSISLLWRNEAGTKVRGVVDLSSSTQSTPPCQVLTTAVPNRDKKRMRNQTSDYQQQQRQIHCLSLSARRTKQACVPPTSYLAKPVAGMTRSCLVSACACVSNPPNPSPHPSIARTERQFAGVGRWAGCMHCISVQPCPACRQLIPRGEVRGEQEKGTQHGTRRGDFPAVSPTSQPASQPASQFAPRREGKVRWLIGYRCPSTHAHAHGPGQPGKTRGGRTRSGPGRHSRALRLQAGSSDHTSHHGVWPAAGGLSTSSPAAKPFQRACFMPQRAGQQQQVEYSLTLSRGVVCV